MHETMCVRARHFNDSRSLRKTLLKSLEKSSSRQEVVVGKKPSVLVKYRILKREKIKTDEAEQYHI